MRWEELHSRLDKEKSHNFRLFSANQYKVNKDKQG